MIMIPRHHPVLEGLHSHYIKMERFLKHYQEEIGSGCVHIKSAQVEGAIFFDSGQLLSADLQNGNHSDCGKKAFSVLMEQVEKHNFSVSVFSVEPDMIHFWANLSQAQPLYRDLSTDLTDLNRLITKMQSQSFSGIIEVIVGGGPEVGHLFFAAGKLVGASPPPGEPRTAMEGIQQYLIDQTTAKGGTFNVSQLASKIPGAMENPQRGPESPLPADSNGPPKVFNPIPMAQELLNLLESECRESRRTTDFQTSFRKALLETSGKFPFLDPFLKEFEYINGKVRLEDHVDPKIFLSGVLTCVKRMIAQLNLKDQFETRSSNWFKSNHAVLKDFGLSDRL